MASPDIIRIALQKKLQNFHFNILNIQNIQVYNFLLFSRISFISVIGNSGEEDMPQPFTFPSLASWMEQIPG